jgi:hypothetical protein
MLGGSSNRQVGDADPRVAKSTATKQTPLSLYSYAPTRM